MKLERLTERPAVLEGVESAGRHFVSSALFHDVRYAERDVVRRRLARHALRALRRPDRQEQAADALAPHKGNVIWRAFVYDEDVDPDRAKRAYIEFTRLDGKFRPNVAIQVKNGALAPPARPGHGIVFDWNALSRHEVTGKVTDFTPTRIFGLH